MSNALLKLPPQARERLRRALGRGEVVVWAGQPRIAAALPAALFMSVFAIGFAGFCVTWEGAALHFLWDATLGPNRSKTPPLVAGLMALFGLPFVGACLGMLWKPVALLRQTRSTVYAVTTMRVLTISGETRHVDSTLPGAIRAVRRRAFPPAIARWVGGSVLLSHGSQRNSDGDVYEAVTRLDGLDDPRGAETALLRLTRLPRENAREPAPV